MPGSKAHVQLIPLEPWTWSKPHIIEQLTPKPVIDKHAPPSDPPYHVSPIDYNTAFKASQLIRLNFPVKSAFIYLTITACYATKHSLS